MSVTATYGENLARRVCDRISNLLRCDVTVVDQFGTPVATSFPTADHSNGRAALPPVARVPIDLDGRPGYVLVVPRQHGEPVTPRLAEGLVELVVNQTEATDGLHDRHKSRDRLISELLHGSGADKETLMRHAELLGIDLAPPRAVILINAADYILGGNENEPLEPASRRRAQVIISTVVSFFMLPNDSICGYIGNGEVALPKASNTKNLKNWVDHVDGTDGGNPSWANLAALKRAAGALLTRLRADTRSDVSIGIGRYHPGVRGLAASYSDARAALSLGRRFHGQNRVHCLDELGVAAFIGVPDERTKIDLAIHLLSPLDSWPELLETLEVFFAKNCSPTFTARQLEIHRNTLTYRLNKIASLTGLDPGCFDEAMQIRLALTVRSLHV